MVWQLRHDFCRERLNGCYVNKKWEKCGKTSDIFSAVKYQGNFWKFFTLFCIFKKTSQNLLTFFFVEILQFQYLKNSITI